MQINEVLLLCILSRPGAAVEERGQMTLLTIKYYLKHVLVGFVSVPLS